MQPLQSVMWTMAPSIELLEIALLNYLAITLPLSDLSAFNSNICYNRPHTVMVNGLIDYQNGQIVV